MNKSEYVKNWRRNTKEKIVQSMGGCCQIPSCGYFRCQDALELHHIDPTQKELSFAKIRANPKSIQKIYEELKKCILLCSNCHKEIHANLIELPDNYSKVDPDILFAKNKKCLECGSSFMDIHESHFCSSQCLGKYNQIKKTAPLDGIDLRELMIQFNNVKSHVAKHLGVSETAIRSRLKKMDAA